MRHTTVVQKVNAAVEEHIDYGKTTIDGPALANYLQEPRDYVLYVLREHPLVNRHSLGRGHYQLLTDEEKYSQRPRHAEPKRTFCHNCFLPLPVSQESHDC